MTQLPRNTVWCEDGEWYCDPQVVAPYLGLTPEGFRQAMRKGAVTGTVERGEGEDAGRTRLTYRYLDRAWSVCVEPDGRIFEVAPPVTGGAALDWLIGRRTRLLWRAGPETGEPSNRDE